MILPRPSCGVSRAAVQGDSISGLTFLWVVASTSKKNRRGLRPRRYFLCILSKKSSIKVVFLKNFGPNHPPPPPPVIGNIPYIPNIRNILNIPNVRNVPNTPNIPNIQNIP